MASDSAIRVDDDLPPRQTAIAVRAANHELARRVHVVGNAAVGQFLRQARIDDVGDDGKVYID